MFDQISKHFDETFPVFGLLYKRVFQQSTSNELLYYYIHIILYTRIVFQFVTEIAFEASQFKIEIEISKLTQFKLRGFKGNLSEL